MVKISGEVNMCSKQERARRLSAIEFLFQVDFSGHSYFVSMPTFVFVCLPLAGFLSS